jgi:hypothetical protein
MNGTASMTFSVLHLEDVFSDGSITTGREVPIYTL